MALHTDFNDQAAEGYVLAQTTELPPIVVTAEGPNRAEQIANAYIEQHFNPSVQEHLATLPENERAAHEAAADAYRDRLHDAIVAYESVEVTPEQVVAARGDYLQNVMQRELDQFAERAGFNDSAEWMENGSPLPDDVPSTMQQFIKDGALDIAALREYHTQFLPAPQNFEAGLRRDAINANHPEMRLTDQQAFEGYGGLNFAQQRQYANTQFDEDGNAINPSPELRGLLENIKDGSTLPSYLTDSPEGNNIGLDGADRYLLNRQRIIQDLDARTVEPPEVIREGNLDTGTPVQVASLDPAAGLAEIETPAAETATPAVTETAPAADNTAETEFNFNQLMAQGGIGAVMVALLQTLGERFIGSMENPMMARIWGAVSEFLGEAAPGNAAENTPATPQEMATELRAVSNGEPVTLTDAALVANDQQDLSDAQREQIRAMAEELGIEPNTQLDIANNPQHMQAALTMGAAIEAGGNDRVSAETQAAIREASGLPPAEQQAGLEERQPTNTNGMALG